MKKYIRSCIELVLILLIGRILGEIPVFVNHVFLPIFKLYQNSFGVVFNLIPFSIGDVLYAVVFIFICIYIFKCIQALLKKNSQNFQKLALVGLKYTKILVVVYYFLWGWVYYLTDLEELYSTENIEVQELKELAIQYRIQCDTLRKKLGSNNQAFILSQTNEACSEEIHQTYSTLPVGLKKIQTPQKSIPKKSLYSLLMVRLGVAGYFNPFTQECQYISQISDYKIPRTFAHELSHKWAYGKESEASFIAFVLGEKTEHEPLAYSTKFGALGSLLYNIYPHDSIFVKEQKNLFSTGMKADRKADSILQIQYNSPLENTFRGLNSTFLKMNNQEGISSYNRYIRLVVGYNRKNNNQ